MWRFARFRSHSKGHSFADLFLTYIISLLVGLATSKNVDSDNLAFDRHAHSCALTSMFGKNAPRAKEVSEQMGTQPPICDKNAI